MRLTFLSIAGMSKMLPASLYIAFSAKTVLPVLGWVSELLWRSESESHHLLRLRSL
jgi:hypothetical protein